MTGADIDTIATDRLRELELAWNRADGTAFGAAFTDDADFVDIRGDHHTGSGAIAGGHQAIFDSIYAGSTVRYDLDTARTVAPGCIVVVATGTLDAPHGPLQGINRSRMTAVMSVHGDRWLITSFQNTLIAA